jgi:hypothetical protein
MAGNPIQELTAALTRAAAALGGTPAPVSSNPVALPLHTTAVPGPAYQPPGVPTGPGSAPATYGMAMAWTMAQGNPGLLAPGPAGQAARGAAASQFQATRDRLFPEDTGMGQAAVALRGFIDGLAGATRMLGTLRGAYSGVMGIMERGNPNMAGQMQGTIDLMANRLAGALAPLIEQINAGLQGLTDNKPGATSGALATGTLVAGGMTAAALFGAPVSIPVIAAATVAALVGGSALGAWATGEKALPSSRGLPQPTAGEGNAWYEQAMLKSLSLQPGTIEAENERRRLELLEKQVGLLQSIDNAVRGSAPSFR